MNQKFTQTEQKLLQILSDGDEHTKEELHGCLFDELGGVNNIQIHISNIRKKIRPRGFDIVCINYRSGTRYRQMRTLHCSANE